VWKSFTEEQRGEIVHCVDCRIKEYEMKRDTLIEEGRADSSIDNHIKQLNDIYHNVLKGFKYVDSNSIYNKYASPLDESQSNRLSDVCKYYGYDHLSYAFHILG
jgi:hypothetical protein